MRSNYALIFVLILSSCAGRTKYGPHVGREGGFSSSKISENIYLSRFAANGHTHQDDAYLFSQFHAIEYCLEKGFKFTRNLEVKDLTEDRKVIHTSSSFSKLSSNVFGSSTSYEEKINLPTFDTIFSCYNEFKIIGAKISIVPAEKATILTKDFLDALQVEMIPLYSPNSNVLRVGDIILKVNGARIRNLLELTTELSKTGLKADLELVRDGARVMKTVHTADGSSILAEENSRIIKLACKVPEIKEKTICTDIELIKNMGVGN